MPISQRRRQLAIILAALAISLAIGLAIIPKQPARAQSAGTVWGVQTYAAYGPTALTGSTTVYSSSPDTTVSTDPAKSAYWNAVDVFVTITNATTNTITITPQWSPDGTNWFNHSDIAATEIITWSLVPSDTSVAKMVAINAHGRFLRLKIAHSAACTPTAWFTYRNN